ncbi:MAG: hypothetical protein R2912_12585 [Eubacteriales bacterium]
MMPVGYKDDFPKNVNYFDSLNQCIAKGKAYLDYDRKRTAYADQTGSVRKGVGMAIFWYNTAVWPIMVGGVELPHGHEPGWFGAVAHRRNGNRSGR